MISRSVIVLCLASLPLCSCEKALQAVKRLKPVEKESSSDATSETAKTTLPTPPVEQMVVNVDSAGFEGFTHKPGALRVVAFHAEWCGPCKKLAPVLASVAAEYGGWVSVGRVDVDKSPDLASRHKVSAIPDIRLFRDGLEVANFRGVVPPDKMRGLFDQYTKDLRAPVSKGAPAAGGQAPAAAPASTPANPTVQPMSKDWLPPGMQRR